MERQITMGEIAAAAADAVRQDTFHVMPGSVRSYDEGQETADVQPMTNDVRIDLDTGARISEPWDLKKGVPVAWPRFGGFVIKGTLAPGDPVMLVAFDLDPTPWRAGGRNGGPVDPGDIRRHGGGYWHAVPTNLLLGRPQGPPTGKLTIGAEGQAPLIVIDGTNIQLGSTGADFVALASLVAAELTKIAATLLTGTTSAGPVAFGTPYSPGPVASALVKSD